MRDLDFFRAHLHEVFQIAVNKPRLRLAAILSILLPAHFAPLLYLLLFINLHFEECQIA